jgi:dynein heavy chain 1, cytosolic
MLVVSLSLRDSCPLLLVDYPIQDSLRQIYRCFNHALLKLHPNLRGYVDSLTDSMVDFYSKNQERFTPDVAPQYTYSLGCDDHR